MHRFISRLRRRASETRSEGGMSRSSSSSRQNSIDLMMDESKDHDGSDNDERQENDDRRSVQSLDDAISKRRLKSCNSASGMSAQDLRATIRDVQQDSSLSPEEKAKRIQELMTFSWRKSQEVKKTASAKKRTRSAKQLPHYKNDGANGTPPRPSSRLSSVSASSTPNVLRQQRLRNQQSSEDEFADIDATKVEDEEGTDDDEEEVIKTFTDETCETMGCKHYPRKCMVSAPCCNTFYTCRFCHDEEEEHEIDRYAINRIRCMECSTVQGIGESCISCGLKFGKYFCGSCKFFDDTENKHIYHCDDCGICRIGEGLGIDYFHCKTCRACMSISLKDHKCVERSLESNCPVCSEYLFTSTIPVMFLPCGHTIHCHCYETYTKTNYVCPICSRSLGDMSAYFRRIDEMLANEQMPEEYQKLRSRIFCSDCEARSIAPYHFIYHKCSDCGSYNTKVLEQLEPEEDK